MADGRPEYPVALPNAHAILNQGSWIIDTAVPDDHPAAELL
jgi:hypothetical protein